MSSVIKQRVMCLAAEIDRLGASTTQSDLAISAGQAQSSATALRQSMTSKN
jgi:hypothetical protein